MITPDDSRPDQERRQRDMEAYYRNVFGSAEGRKVLGDIMAFCHFGKLLNDETERVEYNVGVAIARMSGIMSEIDQQLGIGED
jgi:hypothetical protein